MRLNPNLLRLYEYSSNSSSLRWTPRAGLVDRPRRRGAVLDFLCVDRCWHVQARFGCGGAAVGRDGGVA